LEVGGFRSIRIVRSVGSVGSVGNCRAERVLTCNTLRLNDLGIKMRKWEREW